MGAANERATCISAAGPARQMQAVLAERAGGGIGDIGDIGDTAGRCPCPIGRGAGQPEKAGEQIRQAGPCQGLAPVRPARRLSSNAN